MPADSELNSVLIRRQEINDAIDNGDEVKLKYRVVNVYTEFHEFSRKEVKQYEATFKKWVKILNLFPSLWLSRQKWVGTLKTCLKTVLSLFFKKKKTYKAEPEVVDM